MPDHRKIARSTGEVAFRFDREVYGMRRPFYSARLGSSLLWARHGAGRKIGVAPCIQFNF
jgi:hypothetical protein